MYRWHIINALIRKNNYKSYLELGVRKGGCFKQIECSHKIGVDVEPGRYVSHTMSSDSFFIQNGAYFDIIFIDALHEAIQVRRDIENALHFLKEGGTIVCHDMNPTTKEMQIVPRQQAEWTGDSWKAFVRLRAERDDLTMRVVDTDYGCGIIQRGSQKPLELRDNLTYENLDKNRVEWLNLISVDDFEKIYL